MKKRFLLGIDLGTSHSSMFYAPLPAEGRIDSKNIRHVKIPQLTAQGQLGQQETLPSWVYFPTKEEGQRGGLSLPEIPSSGPEIVAGNWARSQGVHYPDRSVRSAKSWLGATYSHAGDEILPLGVHTSKKMSPLAVMRFLLGHLLEAFAYHLSRFEGVEEGMWVPAETEVIIGIPASYNELARSQTVAIAEEFGLKAVRLLEEPMAAFYSWIGQTEEVWRKQVEAGDLVLVCDLGGGTCDFSLIAVHEKQGVLNLERVAVGDHLILGGDNMDLALALHAKALFEKEGKPVGQVDFLSLLSQVREVKERLWSDEGAGLDSASLTLLGRGSSLLKSRRSMKLHQEELNRLLLEGFFPKLSPDSLVHESREAMREVALDYAKDPRVTAHMSAFLRKSYEIASGLSEVFPFLKPALDEADSRNEGQSARMLLPTAVLFNGGVFKAPVLRRRVVQQLENWAGQNAPSIKELGSQNLDLAVGYGAAYYAALLAGGEGLRIKNYARKTYYLGLEESALAVPGYKPPIRGLCVLPQGTEEGSVVELEGRELALRTGSHVHFRFFSSAGRVEDGAGDFVEDAPGVLDEEASLETLLDAGEGVEQSYLPVVLSTSLSDEGTLNLALSHQASKKQWMLDFNLGAGHDGSTQSEA